MNAESSSAYRIVAYDALRQRPYRILAGIALSLLAHAVLLFGWRHSLQPRPADTVHEVRSIAVWLRPPPPPPPAAPVAEAAPKPAPARQARAARQPARSTELIAIPKATPEATLPPDSFTVEQAPPDSAPRFDPEAAKKLARQLASDPKVVHDGTAAGQVEPKPLATETKAARAIASAKRRDCKDGLPGGLLGPLFLLMDKKDSGCKW